MYENFDFYFDIFFILIFFYFKLLIIESHLQINIVKYYQNNKININEIKMEESVK